jgi:hypothetical protein
VTDQQQQESSQAALQEWAQALICMEQLAGSSYRNPPFRSLPGLEHPAIITQAAFEETFRPASPIEVYSDDRPVFVRKSQSEDPWIPIDVLLGCYDPQGRIIKIFHKNVEHFASAKFNCAPRDLEFIVRLHEYAHALIHLGVFWKDELGLIRDYPNGGETDWNTFLSRRSEAFRSLPDEVHEFLAQLVSWITVGMLEPRSYRDQLQELFIALMDRQPPHYVLAAEILGKAAYADPTFLFSWARKVGRDTPPCGKVDGKAAEALLRVTFP